MTLADLAGKGREALISHVCDSYEVKLTELERFEIVVAHESVGSWGCDSSSTWVLRDGASWYVVEGSHCSCYGFEGQWKPLLVTLAYLLSEHFQVSRGGYGPELDDTAIREHIRQIAEANK